jgi:hypothetical protein
VDVGPSEGLFLALFLAVRAGTEPVASSLQNRLKPSRPASATAHGAQLGRLRLDVLRLDEPRRFHLVPERRLPNLAERACGMVVASFTLSNRCEYTPSVIEALECPSA